MSDQPQAYPLKWPLGHPRTEKPRKSLFVVSRAQAIQGVVEQLRLWKATGVVISSNVPLRRDGLPYANTSAPDDAGVAVYFQIRGKLQVIPCDEYKDVAHNIRAIGYVLEALRTIERHGGTGVFSTAFSGFQALPAKGETTGARWWDVLQVSPNASIDEVRQAHRALAKKYHSDVHHTAAPELMAHINAARDEALLYLNQSIKEP